ncbi:MAG TPA: phosphatase domain-containing protein [Pyrinomonadaceae bacterium]|nr:phosphatase domain-containing protein [Pyrinomonadaceae bacterium]
MPTLFEKKLTFYPTYGYRPQDGSGVWRIPARAWVRNERPMPPDSVIRLCVDEEGELSEKLFLRLKECVRDFVARDNEGEEVRFTFDGDPAREKFRLRGETDGNGIIIEEFDLPDEAAGRIIAAQPDAGRGGWLKLTAETSGLSGKATSSSAVRLTEPHGLSVVSDIDDTVKVTEVPAGKRAVLRRTFLMDYEEAEGMRERYQKILERNPDFDNVAFHYVSGSPWQLFRLLHEFLVGTAGFPAGTFHMKGVNVDLEDFVSSFRDIGKLLAGSEDTERQKREQISEVMRRFPGRKFILIGDSGERDPEVFRWLKGQFGDQVAKIYIRDVTELGEGAERLGGMLRLDTRGVCLQEGGD